MEIYYSSTYDLENCKCKPNYQDVYVVAKVPAVVAIWKGRRRQLCEYEAMLVDCNSAVDMRRQYLEYIVRE